MLSRLRTLATGDASYAHEPSRMLVQYMQILLRDYVHQKPTP